MKKILIFLFFVIGFFSVKTAFSIDEWVVNDIKAYKSDIDSATAKRKAITTAQKKAFSIILKRLGIDESNEVLISNDEIVSMIKSMQIRHEKITKTSYYAVINFEFNEEYTNFVLAKHNLTKGASKINSYLIIPIYQEENSFYVKDEANRWKIPFINATQNQKNIKLIDLNEYADDIDVNNFNDINWNHWSSIAEMNNTNNVVLVLGLYDFATRILNVNINVVNEDDLNTSIMRYTVKNKKNISQSFDDATKKIVNYIKSLDVEKQKKDEQLIMLENNEINIYIPITSIYDFNSATNFVKSNKYISKSEVKSVSKNLAIYKVKFKASSLNEFIKSLKSDGLSVSNKKEGLYIYLGEK